MNKTVKIDGLFKRCFELSENKEKILYSHLPFENRYYVTEYDIVLKVSKPTIYVLTEMGWEQAQTFFSLWYDSMDDFSDIPQQIATELKLGENAIIVRKSRNENEEQ